MKPLDHDGICIEIPGEPVPWKRTGGSGSKRFTNPRYGAWKSNARTLMMVGSRGISPADFPVWVKITVIRKRAKKSKTPGRAWDDRQKGDLDNFCKAVLDSGNGILFDDDQRVVILEASAVLAASDFDDPRIIVSVGRAHSLPSSCPNNPEG